MLSQCLMLQVFGLIRNSYIITHCSKLVARIKYTSVCTLQVI
jgi:hypothetical protein